MTVRLDLEAIDQELRDVEENWSQINADLTRRGLGGKDPFTQTIRLNMLSSYSYLDELLMRQVAPFSDDSIASMLELNNRVHYGTDTALMAEYATSIKANAKKFYANVSPIAGWYSRHAARGNHPYKLAAESYVSILGRPQLFVEGNHRTGSLIASWINLCTGYAPFVLSVHNAVAFFAPSAEIKYFADRSTWRGRVRLPKYRKSFRAFWESHVEEKYLLTDPAWEPVLGPLGQPH